jgi:hypothetical protein
VYRNPAIELQAASARLKAEGVSASEDQPALFAGDLEGEPHARRSRSDDLGAERDADDERSVDEQVVGGRSRQRPGCVAHRNRRKLDRGQRTHRTEIAAQEFARVERVPLVTERPARAR